MRRVLLTLTLAASVAAAQGICSAQGPPKASPPPPSAAAPRAPAPGVTPMRWPGAQASAPEFAPSLQYFGGPVVSSVVTVSVLWGNQVDATVAAAMPGFLNGVTNSAYMDWLCEYNTLGLSGATTNQVIGRGTYAGQYTISPSVSGNTVSDQQIQSEIAAQLASGNLPQPQYDAQGYPETLYVIEFPPGVTIVLPDGSRSCQDFCTYHGTMLYHQDPLMYSVHPDYGTGSPCGSGGCGVGTMVQIQESNHSHELVEAVTDPEVGLPNAPIGWYDPNNGEIGDICNQQEATLTVDGNSFTVQKEWSNRLASCVAVDPGLGAGPAISGTRSVPQGGTISLAASGGSPPYQWSFDAGSGPEAIPDQTAQTLTITDATVADSGSFTVSSRASCTAQSAPWPVTVCPAISLAPAQLAGGVPGQAYQQAITASGGAAPYTYAVTAGALPSGLALSSGGVLSGTPSSAGSYSFTVTASDASGCSGSRAFTLQVAAPPSVSRMAKMGNPFRIVVFGSNLQDHIAVTINGAPWGTVAWKSTSKIVLKGGKSLKLAVPKGVTTTFTFTNPDGVTTGAVSWNW